MTPDSEFLDLQAAVAGEYSLQRELGRGGMGIVYLARDVQLDRDVAIKVLPSHMASTAESRERFVREARTAARLSHPHIVPIHRVGEAGGFVFFVMMYVEGETLGERLRRTGPLPAAETMRIMREVAWALAYAHGRDVVHRDVKPDNILLEAGTGRALVTDFGIARGGSDASVVTDPGKIMGTAHFMSPEQAASEPVDGRSDLYSLGVVGYLAASGRLPFEAPSVPGLLVRQATQPSPGVLGVAPGLPPALATAIDRCLDRDPARRFADGEAMAAALAPAPDHRAALPPSLRGWLAAQNPLLVPYLGWSGLIGTAALANLVALATGNRPDGPADIYFLAATAAAPLLPVVGFHVSQARRQFRAGHSLADLRSALEVARRERMESEALTTGAVEAPGHRALRLGTVASGTWFLVTGVMIGNGIVPEQGVLFLPPMLATLGLGALSNALDVQFIPNGVRQRWQTGVRERLWNSRAGEWLARRLGAPAISGPVGGGVFRATEVALGVAAAQLYAALPAEWRAQLAELPAIVAALEARAAAARADVELLAAMGPADAGAEDLLATRRSAAAGHLSHTVAALEGIRLDLLRLHAGAGDLAPLTTLLDAARLLGEDVSRLADARREADASGSRGLLGATRVATPA